MNDEGNHTGEALIDTMQASPHRDIELEPKRAPMTVREVGTLSERIL